MTRHILTFCDEETQTGVSYDLDVLSSGLDGLLVGRDSSCQITFPLAHLDSDERASKIARMRMTMSRVHALLVNLGGNFFIQDLEPTHPTSIRTSTSSYLLPQSFSKMLNPGDKIYFGGFDQIEYREIND